MIDRDTESEKSSSDEEEEEAANVVLPEEERIQKGKTPITITLKKVCKVVFVTLFFQIFLLSTILYSQGFIIFQVCKRSGHEAGFRGATYIDCPMKPCFLCKLPGNFCPLTALTFSPQY